MVLENILNCVDLITDSVSPYEEKRPFLSTGDLNVDQITNLEYLTFEEKPSRANLNVKEGDIIVARMQGTTKVKVITNDISNIIVSTGFLVIRPKNNVDLNYLKNIFLAEDFQRKKDKYCTGATQKAINNSNFSKIQIPLPPLEEQKAIAARLDKADEIRQLNQQIINHYEELIQALFIDMFGDPVKNEKGWEKSIIGEVCTKIQIGPFGSQLHQSDYVDNGLPLINPVNIKKDKIDLLNSVKITQEKYDELPNYHLRIHDIILARRGDLSKIGYIKNENNFCGTGSLFIRLKSSLNSFFIFKLLNHTSTINYLYKNAQGVTMPNLNKKIVYNIPIFLPPIELQNQFAERVQKIEAQKELAVQALQQSEDLFNSLLQQAFKK